MLLNNLTPNSLPIECLYYVDYGNALAHQAMIVGAVIGVILGAVAVILVVRMYADRE